LLCLLWCWPVVSGLTDKIHHSLLKYSLFEYVVMCQCSCPSFYSHRYKLNLTAVINESTVALQLYDVITCRKLYHHFIRNILQLPFTERKGLWKQNFARNALYLRLPCCGQLQIAWVYIANLRSVGKFKISDFYSNKIHLFLFLASIYVWHVT
jgi:hypothetical protein